MYYIWISLIVSAALLKLGAGFPSGPCASDKCLWKIQQAQRQVLRIDWKPISVFPEEAKRFR